MNWLSMGSIRWGSLWAVEAMGVPRSQLPELGSHSEIPGWPQLARNTFGRMTASVERKHGACPQAAKPLSVTDTPWFRFRHELWSGLSMEAKVPWPTSGRKKSRKPGNLLRGRRNAAARNRRSPTRYSMNTPQGDSATGREFALSRRNRPSHFKVRPKRRRPEPEVIAAKQDDRP